MLMWPHAFSEYTAENQHVELKNHPIEKEHVGVAIVRYCSSGNYDCGWDAMGYDDGDGNLDYGCARCIFLLNEEL